MKVKWFDTPLGPMTVSSSTTGITKLQFGQIEINESSLEPGDETLVDECIRQVGEYFAGSRKEFDVPLDPQGTDFQKGVWKQLQNIPLGKSVSYLDVAKKLGDPGKIRAVGNANGKNPIAIIIPCHRVIGSDGSLTGYAGGLDKKRWLLEFEGVLPPQLF